MAKRQVGGVRMTSLHSEAFTPDMLMQLRTSHNMGSVAGLSGAMLFWGDIIQGIKDPEIRSEIDGFKKFVESGDLVEAKLGKGALLNLDHELVQYGIEIGQYDARMVDAAETFRREGTEKRSATPG